MCLSMNWYVHDHCCQKKEGSFCSSSVFEKMKMVDALFSHYVVCQIEKKGEEEEERCRKCQIDGFEGNHFFNLFFTEMKQSRSNTRGQCVRQPNPIESIHRSGNGSKSQLICWRITFLYVEIFI